MDFLGYRFVFSARLILSGFLAGFIFVVMSGSVAGQEVKPCLECHPGYTKRFQKEFYHAPFETGDCYSCHKFHGFRNSVEINGEIRTICSRCHEEISMLSDDYIHQPLADGDTSCLNCHDPHSGTSENLLKLPTDSLCIECHDAPDPADEKVHAPYGKGNCVICHDPHGSPFGTGFLMPLEYLCLECHADDFEGLDPGMLHAVDREQSCDKCHNGHESSNKALLKAEPEQLCLSCHTKMKAELESAPRHTILDGEDCLVCHKPHFMLSGDFLVSSGKELCLGCHDHIGELMKAAVVHPAMDDDCTICHDPHLKMAPGIQPGLCAECHDLEDQAFRDSHYNLQPANCGGCHNPHGSSKPKLMRAYGHVPFVDRECDICHDQGGSDGRLKSNDLCLDCHDFETRGEVHGKVDLATDKCLDCHSPHVSDQAKLKKSRTK